MIYTRESNVYVTMYSKYKYTYKLKRSVTWHDEVKKDLTTGELFTGVIYTSNVETAIWSINVFENGLQHSFVEPSSVIKMGLYDNPSFHYEWRFRNKPVNFVRKEDVQNYYYWLLESGIDDQNITPEDEQLIMMKWT